jgi:hypothetical protein
MKNASMMGTRRMQQCRPPAEILNKFAIGSLLAGTSSFRRPAKMSIAPAADLEAAKANSTHNFRVSWPP